MDITTKEKTRETLLQYYRELREKKGLSERVPNINVIFGEFLARKGHRRFFMYDCKSFINIKGNAGYFLITFSVYDESSGEIDEFIARWHLLRNGQEKFMVQKIVDLDDVSLGKLENQFDKSYEELENHFKIIFQEFIEFFKKKNLICSKN